MPQIANQDYNVVKVTPGIDDIAIDAHVLGELKRHFLQGTIFDVIVIDNETILRRIVAAKDGEYGLAATDYVSPITVPEYSVEQYEGLAAIQAAALDVGVAVERIPKLYYGYGTTELGEGAMDSGEAGPIVDEDGNVYHATIENDILTAVQKTQHAPEYVGWDVSPITVPFEEVQKLVGLRIDEH